MEYKLFDTPQVKVLGDDTGEIEGYASTFGNWDDMRERVAKGAFSRHLDSFVKDGFVAVGHMWSDLPVAMPISANEDEHGLFVRARFHSTQRAQEARTTIRERLDNGKSVRLSIGFEVLADEYTEEGRILKDIKLYEFSYVTVPANPLAVVTGAKHLPAGAGPLSAYAEAAEAAIAAFVTEAQCLGGRRAKAGRVLSEANRKRITTLLDSLKSVSEDLEALLRETEPKADPADVQKELARFYRAQAMLNGVLLP